MGETTGFLFAFKVYIKNSTRRPLLDAVEDMVHHLTRSDLIHVEIIPILGGYVCPSEENKGFLHKESFLWASSQAHTAYVGRGYNVHPAASCIYDPSYIHIFVPLESREIMLQVPYPYPLERREGTEKCIFFPSIGPHLFGQFRWQTLQLRGSPLHAVSRKLQVSNH